MPSRKAITYTGLLDDLYYRKNDIDDDDVLRLLRKAQSIPKKLLPFKGIIHVIDYRQRRHVGISGPLKTMMGYDPRDICDNGLDFVIDIFQKDDFKIYNEKMFNHVTTFLQNTPQPKHDAYIFSYSYRMKRKDGKFIYLFQQGSYITDPKSGLPLYGIALVTDITPLKKENSMIFAIDKKEVKNSTDRNIQSEYYYPDPDECKLSKREIEIVCWLADGLSSKQIADKLRLSESTVVNHRKNILKKTNTKNVAELIQYSNKKGFI